ncbi:MAG: NAD(P)/FAD-dependent oxidoreductase [Alphaproteobacteria bacterium]|jgi:cation diffusion facilitator CzcD-associated flavoprotein CzcO|nr:NAD(P)/FAD-dependent oxidoreductase [Alphaproteobacteria bacterium]
MNVAVEMSESTSQTVEHFDVLIVGAGISGIDAAYHLQQQCPAKSFVLLENQESFGGTWLTHKFPGIRSDSDLFTFGYKWKPWSGPPIATAEEILNYLDEVLDEQDIRRHIRYLHQVRTATWSGEDKCWTLEVTGADGGESRRFTGNFLWMCQGYYRHSEGYTPDFPGMERFQGPIVHPQTWPEDLDYKGKQVVVIGSGATAATLIPAMAGDCAHITMLQRSPTFFYARPNSNEVADMLRQLDIPEEWTHEIVRQQILKDQQEITRRSFEDSDALKDELIAGAKAYLGEDFDVDTHFTPSYRPWRQRLAIVPDGDLFKGIRAGQASVVTDQIETFTERGILLTSGRELEADIIVTATGFNLSALGDIDFTIDGEPLNFADCWAHRGILFSGIPNMAWVFGYLRTSWTMRADMVAGFVCRLLNHMAEKGADVVTPQLREADKDMPALPLVADENFNAGYLVRKMHIMPKQGDREPWIFSQDYYSEKDEIPAADLDDGTLIYR